ncbi:MAG: DUF1109 family protein [Leptospiraceae bacterium]|nr:DUF1109 family protein [Leptospiraceae bacterium]MCP5494694.1 DUF1109 family protein [Leptospiraceae bacterium]
MKTEELISNLVSNLKPVKKISLTYVILKWLFLSLVYIFTLFFIKTNYLLYFHNYSSLIDLTLLGSIFILAGFTSLLHGMPGSYWILQTRFIVLCLAVFWVFYLGVKIILQKSFAYQDIDLIGFFCVGNIIITSFLPIFFLYFFIKQMAPLDFKWAGVMIMLSSMSLAALIVQVNCDIVASAHILIYHALPVVLLGGTGFEVGKKLFKNLI